MKIKEIREMETGHLLEELASKQKHLFDLRTQAVTEKLENPSQLQKTRRDIARIKMTLWQRGTEKSAAADQERQS
jgi:large subunit ribosomal protein L29